jgi:hypothetical protein
MAKIFISYKRNVEPDTPVAIAVYESLQQDHEVFIDTTIQVGEKWAERIEKAIQESDYLISFLSEHSMNSEMVIAEIETAYHYDLWQAIYSPCTFEFQRTADLSLKCLSQSIAMGSRIKT